MSFSPKLLPLLLFLLCHVTLTSSSNVLVVSGIPGSHLFTMADVAEVLVNFNFNVTLFSINADSRVDMRDRGFHFISVEDEATSEKLMSSWTGVIEDILPLPSEDMLVDQITATEKTREACYTLSRTMKAHFEGEEFARTLEDGNYDVIVMDDYASMSAMVKLQEVNIPVIGINCLADMK